FPHGHVHHHAARGRRSVGPLLATETAPVDATGAAWPAKHPHRRVATSPTGGRLLGSLAQQVVDLALDRRHRLGGRLLAGAHLVVRGGVEIPWCWSSTTRPRS